MKISVIVTSGSLEFNAHVRENCLWRCVNAMHNQPGRPFELILIDNTTGGRHRRALREVFDTYRTVTHLVQNRINERAGGGYRQGVAMADGEIIVTAADDILPSPGWLEALVAPLEAFPDKNLVAALQIGPSVRGNVLEAISAGGREYQVVNRAGAYLWAVHRKAYKKASWGRIHFADTRLCQQFLRNGYRFVIPAEDRWLKHTNLNFFRAWDYQGDKRKHPADEKWVHLEDAWKNGITNKAPVIPTRVFPLKNPVGQGPGCYLTEYLDKWKSTEEL